ncbi:NAD(P)-binding protein [Xylariaceae sp. FL0255]|nr:NAD(P)-binding protein [Xylariaceae sp. FL0255]
MDSFDPTNWPLVRDFVATAHHDTYPFVSTSNADSSGKSVFITGASRGIGKAIAVSFAQAGCSQIAVAARTGVDKVKDEMLSAAQAAGRPKPHIVTLKLDVTSEKNVADAAITVSEAFNGSLDILVNSAGSAMAITALGETQVDEWWAQWELHVRGTYLCTRALLPLLLKSVTRTVIIVSSAGAHMLTRGLLGYQVSKVAQTRFAEFLAKEYEEQGLIAFSVHPGDVLTDMVKITPKEWLPVFKDKPELAGDTLVWLGKARREWLSGRFVSCTWDMEELEKRKEEIVSKDLFKFRLTV